MAASAHQMPFGAVLDAVDQLPLEEQRELAAILLRRLAEQGRKQLVRDVDEARQEFAGGGSRPATADELMGEILS
jgi:hypothetical protein